jgi:4-hydroxybenzoyl-CoA thioesterase
MAFEDFFTGALKRPYPEVIAQGVGFPTVKLEVEYLAPVRFGDRVEMGVAIEKIGRTSLHVRYEGRVGQDLRFHARNVVVCVDMKMFAPRPIPDDLRAAFETQRG